MTPMEDLLDEFCDAWERGRRPNAADFLERAPQGEEEHLRGCLERYLLGAATPDYSRATLAELCASRVVREANRGLAGRSGCWPILLPSLRRQARISRSELAASIAQRLGYPDATPRVHDHVHSLEAGVLDARRVAEAVLRAIADELGATVSDLRQAAEVPTLAAAMGPRVSVMRREYDRRPPFSEVPDDYEPPAPVPASWLLVDALFLGADATR